jgi:hypothetical protein
MRPMVRAALLAMPLAAGVATAQVPVDLHTWSAQSYPAVAGFGAGVWNVALDGSSVHQTVNGQPTLFASDFNAHGTEVTGRIRVNSNNDNDYIGFALGYDVGDIGDPAADYLLVDWKQGTQFFDFGNPSTTPGSTAPTGLAVSRVTGVPTADEFWGHTNFAAHPGGAVAELQRGTTRGSTGWVVGSTYEFRFVFQPTLLQVYVDGGLELSVNGAFANGRMAFYNFSQADVTYSAFTVRQVAIVPEPATVALVGTGLLALAGLARVTGRARRAAA